MAAVRNGLAERVASERGDAFDVLTELGQAAKHSTSWCATRPPSPSRRRIRRRGCAPMARMARLAAPLVAPGGFLFAASCSHHAPMETFAATIAEGVQRARREARIVFAGGAGPDHPVHPLLPESAYLKAQLIELL